LGSPGPLLLEAGISSSYHIARFFGLTRRPVDLVPGEMAQGVVEPPPHEAPAGLAAMIRKALHFLGLR
jgi:hypothetical protein